MFSSLETTSVYIGCSLLAFIAIALWIWLKATRNERRHDELNFPVPPSVMRKAPPPTLPDAIRLLPRKETVYCTPAPILNISGGIPTLNNRSRAFEKVMNDIPSTSFHNGRLKYPPGQV